MLIQLVAGDKKGTTFRARKMRLVVVLVQLAGGKEPLQGIIVSQRIKGNRIRTIPHCAQ